ncbi:MAG: hypothetical protein HY928_05310 [Elusimicrobia bacterium]|nr:hypothetical protein [Elusimicrobiota bacterium]
MKTTLLLVVLFSSPALGQGPEALRLEGSQAFAALDAQPPRSPGYAAPAKLGPCGLPRYSGDPAMVVVGEPLWVESARGLAALNGEQVLRTARMVAARIDGPRAFGSVAAAVRFLKKSSEGEDLYITDFRFAGKEYTKVAHYPGGNQSGVVFAFGTAEAVAVVADSALSCLARTAEGASAEKADYSHRWSQGKCMAFTGDGREVYAVDVSYCGGYVHRWHQGQCVAFTGDGREVYAVDVSYCD